MEGLDIFLAGKIKILGCSTFIVAGKRQETPGSETKDSVSHDITDTMRFMLVLVSHVPSEGKE